MYEPGMDYSWMFYPPPYNFLSPVCRSGNQSAGGWNLGSGNSGGLSGCGCGCGGHGGCGGGLGQLFSSGLDFTQWGVGEWAVVAGGVYVVASVLGDVSSGAKKVKRTYRRMRA